MGFSNSGVHCRKRSKFRGVFNGICVVVLLFLFSYRENVLQNPFSKPDSKDFSFGSSVFRRKTFENGMNSSTSKSFTRNFVRSRNPTICSEIHKHTGYENECAYLKNNPECNPGGFLDYLGFFYCTCAEYEVLGYAVLVIWLLALFYLLGNTAADYFCCSLEMLSNLLKLPPTVAGVTLLPFGNGAPDVFSSIASFVGRDSGDVGLNSVLGGAVFVTCIVVGTVSFCVSEQSVRVDKKCFIRDVGFFLVTLFYLLFVLIVGKISVGGAIFFLSIYVVYAICIAAGEILREHFRRLRWGYVIPLLPVTGNDRSSGENAEDESITTSLVRSDSQESVPRLKSHHLWASNVAMYCNERVRVDGSDENSKDLWGWKEDESSDDRSWFSCFWMCSSLVERALALPRRLTIPIVEEERWSKAYAVASACFSPVLLAFLWSAQYGSGYVAYVVGAVVGGALGFVALARTENEHPPRRMLFPWVLGGFFMSIVWFYMIANELVALLVAFGVILSIKSSLLALTILAWGNSLGDLMSNVAIAMGGRDGVQVAVSGCFAGPMFNTLIGLGVSLMFGTWSNRPEPYAIPSDSSLYFTLGFLVLGLVWSLVMLPLNGMRPGKLMGAGLVIIYLVFLTLRASIAISDGSIDGSS